MLQTELHEFESVSNALHIKQAITNWYANVVYVLQSDFTFGYFFSRIYLLFRHAEQVAYVLDLLEMK